MRKGSRIARLLLVSSLMATVAQAEPLRALVVARAPGETQFSFRPVQTRVGTAVELAVVVLSDRGRALGPSEGVRIPGVRVQQIEALPAGSTVRWQRVFARPEHRDTPPPNEGIRTYSNAVLFGPRHGRWIGYDRIEYSSEAVSSSARERIANDRLIVQSAAATQGPDDLRAGAGSVWYAAEVQLPDGSIVRTPGVEAVDHFGLSPRVARVSFRASDDFIGWLGTYFGVPYVFGSNGPTDALHQTDRYTGADCADVLVGARRASGVRSTRYTSVAGIHEYADAVTGVLFLGADGVIRDRAGTALTLRWGHEVREGDLVAIDFTADPSNSLPRAWDHIGALARDRGTPGVLDGGDLLRHAADAGLMDQPLREQGPLRMVLWRWRQERSR